MQIRIVIINKKKAQSGFDMENNLVHIAISPNTLASLINSGTIHAVDFRCLDAHAKKTVWKLFLAALKSTIKE